MDASSKTLTSADADPARELCRLVDSAARVLFSIRLGESALIGGSAGALAFAAGIASGVEVSSLELRFAAGLGAIFAALGWWLERKPDIASVVRRIDRREGASGELVTAFESARRSVARRAPTDIEHMLGRRVLAKLSLARCLRAVAPGSVALLAVPLVSAAVLIFAVDAARVGSRAALDVPGAIAALASASDSLRSASAHGVAAGIAPEHARELQSLAHAADRARRDLDSHALSARAAEDLLDRTARLRASISSERADRALDAELAQAESALRAAHADLSTGSADAGTTQAPSPSGALPSAASRVDSGSISSIGETSPKIANPNPTAVSATVRDGGSGASGSGDLAEKPSRDSRGQDAISAAAAARDKVNAPSSTVQDSPTEERGTDGGRWWARRYDAVVERWVEALRTERIDRPGGR